ncbi:MAG: hypothetical protein RL519_978 [Pseudomonadota bacterium]|jgi:hypothetical protein
MTGAELNSEALTDHQWAMCASARQFPVILATRGQSITAASLARNGWGTVEDGASGERIFRLNQAGCDEFAWLDELKDDAA